ncbi:MAG: hypothetical protein JXB23_18075 [Candidatus Aminicenantes bacterium]|nr:hypothetical protein [Candidatus Aminicenantes bacterium]
MNKKILILLWLTVFTFFLKAEDGIPLISEIGLIESDRGSSTTAPLQLIIGVEATRKVFYKLSDDRQVIKGGQFLRGFNSFGIEVGDRFEHSGTYTFALELKTDSQVTRKHFIIDIRLQEPETVTEEPDEEVIKRENIVSMYVGERLIVSNRKLYISELAEKIKAIPRPYSIDPNDSAAEPSMKNTGGVPIMEAVATVANVIKGLFEKKNTEEPLKSVQKKMRITTHFIRNDTSGREIPITAVISLRLDSDFF